MTIPRILLLLKTTAVKWWDDNPWRLSAALSYYTLFSLAPLFTIAVAVAAVVVDESIVQSELLVSSKTSSANQGRPPSPQCCKAPVIRSTAPSPP